jgi:hypothetical protein
VESPKKVQIDECRSLSKPPCAAPSIGQQTWRASQHASTITRNWNPPKAQVTKRPPNNLCLTLHNSLFIVARWAPRTLNFKLRAGELPGPNFPFNKILGENGPELPRVGRYSKSKPLLETRGAPT